jgi:hypothetical protein
MYRGFWFTSGVDNKILYKLDNEFITNKEIYYVDTINK